MNQPLHVFGVSLDQAGQIPPTDFGPLASLASAIRNVPGVFNADAVPAKDQHGNPLILIRVHKHFLPTWKQLTPQIQEAIKRCCNPATRSNGPTLDEDGLNVLAA